MEVELAVGEIYHVFTKSIAGYVIFNDEVEYERIIDCVIHYQNVQPFLKFSKARESAEIIQPRKKRIPRPGQQEKLIELIAYCVMPTHLHFILRQEQEWGISIFMNRLLNSYTRYFNIKHKRKGPLWEGRFKKVLVEGDEQLLHLTRYVHLNPVTAYIVSKPEQWQYSSYQEYVFDDRVNKKICSFKDLIEMSVKEYQQFVEERIDDQRELKKIKDILLE